MSLNKPHKKVSSVLKVVASEELEEEVLQELAAPDPQNPE